MVAQSHNQLKVVEAIRRSDHPKLIPLGTIPTEDLLVMLFKSARVSHGSIRGGALTRDGLTVMKMLFQTWEVTFSQPLRARHKIRFSRACLYPYYAGTKRLICFDSVTGPLLSIVGDDPELLDGILPEHNFRG